MFCLSSEKWHPVSKGLRSNVTLFQFPYYYNKKKSLIKAGWFLVIKLNGVDIVEISVLINSINLTNYVVTRIQDWIWYIIERDITSLMRYIERFQDISHLLMANFFFNVERVDKAISITMIKVALYFWYDGKILNEIFPILILSVIDIFHFSM